jgi:hypothetical protein
MNSFPIILIKLIVFAILFYYFNTFDFFQFLFSVNHLNCAIVGGNNIL